MTATTLPPSTTPGPSRRLLEALAEEASPHLGSLSYDDGLMPVGDPPTALPPSHEAWDQAAAELPRMWRDLSARRELPELPLLSAAPEDLADEHLWRASVVLGALVYAYVRCDMHDLHLPAPVAVPSVLRLPWEEVARRMGRHRAHFSLDDLMLHNWARIDPAGPITVENTRLLVPQTGSPTEAAFCLGFNEVSAACTPLVQAMVRGQDAAASKDVDGVVQSLLDVLDVVHHLTETALMKIDPVPLASPHADPVIWAKLVAPTGIPVVSNVPGVSGAAAAGIQALDNFLGRVTHASPLGQEALHVADNYAPNVRRFVAAMGQAPVRDFVLESGDIGLRGLFQNVVDAYTGDRGYLGVHRRKVYGFIQTAFKVGRPSTASGISGQYRARAWRHAHHALEAARVERVLDMSMQPVPARLAGRTVVAQGSTGPINDIRLDLRGTGLIVRPGDRLAVHPKNDPELVEWTLQALGATGEERVPLTTSWQASLAARHDQLNRGDANLRDFLTHAWLRPLTPEVAEQLVALAPAPSLLALLRERREEGWEVPDALHELRRTGFNPSRMWKAELMDREAISRILPPLPARLYSVAGTEVDDDGLPTTASLVIGHLSFEAEGADGEVRRQRGTASTMMTERLDIGGEVDLTVVRPQRFTLPTDDRGVIMCAAGTGVAPFMGFLEHREAGDGDNWLMLAVRTPDQVPDQERLYRWRDTDHVRLDIAYSREAPEGGPTGRIDRLITSPEVGPELVRWLLETDANLYVCGQGGFASTVMTAVREALAAHGPDGLDPDVAMRQLVADRQVMFDVFTTFTPAADLRPGERPFEVSELIAHTDPDNGYWMAINGVVHDMTEFRHLHPGGRHIVDDNCGVDCTTEFDEVRHHLDPEIVAMLEMYRIGVVRQLSLEGPWGIAIREGKVDAITLQQLYAAWVAEAYTVVELRNSLRNELSVIALPLTDREAVGDLTPLKVGIVVDTMQRFCVQLLAIALGTEIADLWAMTCGLAAPAADAQELGRRLQQGLGHTAGSGTLGEDGGLWPDVADALAAAHDARDRAADAGPDAHAAIADAAATIEGMLTDIVDALGVGLQAFERHEAAVAVVAGPDLLGALAVLPDRLRARRGELATAARALATALEG